MLNKLKPRYALISTGINKFGHPDYLTINYLENKNVNIVSTKNYGFTKIVIKDDIKFYHYDKLEKSVVPVEFKKNIELPFHKSKYVQELIKSSL